MILLVDSATAVNYHPLRYTYLSGHFIGCLLVVSELTSILVRSLSASMILAFFRAPAPCGKTRVIDIHAAAYYSLVGVGKLG